MKTPREILLQRHQAADAKLNQIRREVIAQLEKPPVARAEWLPLCALLKLWRELIWPARRIWAGLATTWVFILIAPTCPKAARLPPPEKKPNQRSFGSCFVSKTS